jgi:hypothetical protein
LEVSAHYLPSLDFQPLSQEQRVERLQERLAAARLAAVTAQTPERLQEVADEIDVIASEWNKEKRNETTWNYRPSARRPPEG